MIMVLRIIAPSGNIRNSISSSIHARQRASVLSRWADEQTSTRDMMFFP